MHIIVLHNADGSLLEDDPGRAAREDVNQVAAAMAEALTHEGFRAEPFAIGEDPLLSLTQLRGKSPDLVVNLCESLAADARGEMAVPCLLDLLGIPYTGSSALSLGLALHKNKAKELLRSAGVSTPGWRTVHRMSDVALVDLPFPLIVKPSREDASVGVSFDSVVSDPGALRDACAYVLTTFQQPALVEQFIEGREIYIPLLGNSPRVALPLSEISFGPAFVGKPKIVSYDAKWAPGSAVYDQSPSGPCEVPLQLQEKLVHTAFGAFDALDCRDYGRVDVRLSADGTPYVIDINLNCDLNPDAGFAKAAKRAGLNYSALAARVVDVALERHHGNSSARRSGPHPARRPAGANRNVLEGRADVRPGVGRPRAAAE